MNLKDVNFVQSENIDNYDNGTLSHENHGLYPNNCCNSNAVDSFSK